MTPKERHTQYVHELVDLADREGKAITAQALGLLAKLPVRAKGNPDALVALMRELRDIIIPLAVKSARATLQRSRTLGRDFGKTRLSDAA